LLILNYGDQVGREQQKLVGEAAILMRHATQKPKQPEPALAEFIFLVPAWALPSFL